MYNIENITAEEGEIVVGVSEISVGFIMDDSTIPSNWGDKMDTKELPDNLPVKIVIINELRNLQTL